jgi:cytochrome c oxidase subunit II
LTTRPTALRRAVATVAGGCGLLVSGCASNGQNALHAQSPQSHDIEVLWWWMLGVASLVFIGACAMLVLGWFSRRSKGLPFVGENEGVNKGLVVAFGIAIPVVILITLFLISNVAVIKATAAPKTSSTKLTIQVIAHDWWWEIRYPGHTAATANEIHIPARTRVNIEGTTDDVIHSLWVPELNRKIDVIPGRVNRVLLYADHPGTYRGQCAEFCGLQHAHMSLYVVADDPAAFQRWLAQQSQPAPATATGLAARGRQLFLANTCASCHTIRGTKANADIGPDLTHVGSRMTLAALTIDNTPAGLLRWITDPQHVKAGAKMPALDLSRPDFVAIADYLRSLK